MAEVFRHPGPRVLLCGTCDDLLFPNEARQSFALWPRAGDICLHCGADLSSGGAALLTAAQAERVRAAKGAS